MNANVEIAAIIPTLIGIIAAMHVIWFVIYLYYSCINGFKRLKLAKTFIIKNVLISFVQNKYTRSLNSESKSWIFPC